MKKDIIVFNSEDEKKKYIEYVEKKYSENKTKILSNTWSVIDNLNTRDNTPSPSFWEIYPAIMIIFGIAWAYTWGLPYSFWLYLFGGSVLLEGILTTKFRDYRGIYVSLFSLIASPFILYHFTRKSIKEKIKHYKNIKAIKKFAVEEKDDDEKKSKLEIIKSLLNEVDVNTVKDDNNTLSTIIEKIEIIKNKARLINNQKISYKIIDSLFEICNLLIRVIGLSKSRREEALSFISKELIEIEKIIPVKVNEETKEETEEIYCESKQAYHK